MKKLYYFSKSKLQFIEIKNYKAKLTLYFILSVFVFSSVILSVTYFISSIANSSKNLISLKAENRELRDNLDKTMQQFTILNKELENIAKADNELRISANLPPVSVDETMVGIGGGSFDNNLDFVTNPSEEKLAKVLSFVDEVSRKLKFEKSQYIDISNKLKENKKLYSSIPAIRPCAGTITDGFGIRFHPILHIKQMHEGLDFTTDVGTPVYATGDGIIDFIGYRAGFGLMVEIDHGYGYVTVYGHLSSALVKDGQKVTRGKEIALSGNSGLSTGPHLHYEVHHDGVALNPEGFFFGDLGFLELTNKN
ncbi:MAG: M23 family metallopeptidase [Ignavibacteriaceae bacterium]